MNYKISSCEDLVQEILRQIHTNGFKTHLRKMGRHSHRLVNYVHNLINGTYTEYIKSSEKFVMKRQANFKN